MLALIRQARNLVLTTQLTLHLQPVVEEILAGHDHLQVLQRDVVRALGLVVAVQLLQFLVQYLLKLTDVLRCTGKLYEPLVATLRVLVHEHRSCRVFKHLGTRLLAGVGQSAFGIVHDELLAKGIDEVLCATRDDEFIRILLSEHDSVANHVAPQSARRTNHHGIVSAHFHALQRHHVGAHVLVQFVQWHKLVEHVVVQHEQHGMVRGVVLDAEETFRSVVGLHVVHARRADNLLVLVAIGCKGDAAVEKHFQVRPHFVERLGTRQLQHAHQHRQHPRRHTAQVGHVLVHRLSGYAVTLHLEVAQQCCMLLRHAYEVGQRVDVFNQDGAQVAHQRVVNIVVGLMAATQDEALAVEHAGLRIVLQIERHHILATTVVNVLQTLLRNRNEFRLVVGRTARLRIPLHSTRPQHIGLAVAHAVDVALQFLITVLRHQASKVVVVVDAVEAVLPTVFSLPASGDEMFKHRLLQCCALSLVAGEFFLSRQECLANNAGQIHFLYFFVSARFLLSATVFSPGRYQPAKILHFSRTTKNLILFK